MQGLTKAGMTPDDCSCHSYFLREAVGSYAENQRITAVRRVYQRGCVNPMINIEQLWRDYSKYEEASEPPGRPFLRPHLHAIVMLKTPTRLSHLQGINVHLAKKMIEDRSRDYMNARRVAKVRRQSMPVQ